jgi:hypothetical protein
MQLATFGYTPAEGWSGSLPAWDSARTLVLAFGASRFHEEPEPLRELARVYSASHLMGCSTAGEIHGATVRDDSLSVAVARFDHVSIDSATATVAGPEHSFHAGQELGRRLDRPGLRGVLVLSDGHNVNGSELVRGLNSVIPRPVVVTGGLAGDGDRFQRTWVVLDGTPRAGIVSAVGFYGDRARIGHGSKGGWDRFGPERRVTRSKGNVLHELDGRPALQLYKEYLGDRAAGLPATALLFPLSLRESGDDERSVVRTVLGIDETTQSMTFAGDVPEGRLAQLMRANFDRLIDGASGAARVSRLLLGAPPILSVAISCVGRRLILGERTEEELEATLDVLPDGTEQVGFYSYGEISPWGLGSCDLHNQTMTLTTISEA